MIETQLANTSTQNAQVLAAQKSVEESLSKMVALQVKMNALNSDLVAKNLSQNIFAVNPDAEMIQVYKDLDKAFANYNKALEQSRAFVAKALGEGSLGPESQELFNTLYGSVEAFTKNSPEAESLLRQVKQTTDELTTVSTKLEKINQERDLLLKAYVEKVAPDSYSFETLNLEKELNKPLSELIENPTRLDSLWKVWQDIWKERPPEQATSLY